MDAVTDASGFPYRPSFDGGLGRCTGAVSCGHRHLPLRIGGHHARGPCVGACARPSWPGRAGQPPGRVLARLTFSLGRFVFLPCSAPSGLGLPLSWSFVCPLPPPFCSFFFSSLLPFPARPLSLLLSLVSGRGCPGPWRCGSVVCCLVVAPPPPFVSRSFSCRCSVLFFIFPLLLSVPPLSLGFSGFRPGSPRALASFVVPALPVAASRWLLLPPPPSPPSLLCLAVFLAAALRSFFFLRCAPPLSLAFLCFRPRVPWAMALCAVCFVGLRPLVSPCALASLVVPALPLAAPWWFLPSPPPPSCVSLFFLLPLCAPFFFPFRAPVLSLATFGFRPQVPWALALCAVCFVGLPLLGSPCAGASFVVSPRPLAAPWWLLPPPPPFVSRCFSRCRFVLRFFFFFPFRAPVVSGFLWFLAPGWPGPWRCGFVLSASRFSALRALSPLLCFPPGRWLLCGVCCPPPPFVSRGFRRCRSVPFFFLRRFSPPAPPPWCVRGALCCLVLPRCAALPFCLLCCGASPCCAVGCCLLCGVCWGVCFCVVLRCWLLLRVMPCLWSCRLVGLLAVWLATWFWSALPYVVLCCLSLGAVLRRAAARRASPCCVVVCCVVLLRLFGVAVCCAVSSGAARRLGAQCSAALCFAVFPHAVCSVLCVFCRGVLVRAVVRRCAACCVCPGVSRCAFPVLSGLCGAVFCCARALLSCCFCGACCCWRLVLWCAAVCCAVSFGVLWCSAGSGGPWSSAGCVFRCRCPCLAAWSGSLWLVWFAVVPCFPVSCSVVLCRLVVLCCCVLLLFCGAVCACLALLWPVVPCCAVLLVVCAVLCPVVVSVCFGALSLPAGTVFCF